MKNFKTFSILVFCTLSVQAWSFELHPQTDDESARCSFNIEYNFYDICYSRKHRQAFWAFHKLTRSTIKGKQKRTNNFKRDSNVNASVGPRDYKGSGFDRGHLVPAGDMKLNYTSMSETFYMTNMSPQRSGFNSGVWRALEAGIRKQVLKRGGAYVVTAPILLSKKSYPRIKSGVSVPDEYYKIAYFPKDELMLAFLIPNHSQKGHSYKSFQVSVDELEELTGYDFFPGLPDDLEDRLESEVFLL